MHRHRERSRQPRGLHTGRAPRRASAAALLAGLALACGSQDTTRTDDQQNAAGASAHSSGASGQAGASAHAGSSAHAGHAGSAGAAVVPAQPGLAGEAWREYLHDSTRRGRTTATVSSSPQVVWKAHLDDLTGFVRPRIDAQGHLYAISAVTLYAFSPDGTLRWSHAAHKIDDPVYVAGSISGALVQPDGSVVLLEDGPPTVVLLGPDGTIRSTQVLPSSSGPVFEFRGEPIDAGDGTFVVLAQAGATYDEVVTLLYRFTNPGELLGPPVVIKGQSPFYAASRADDGTLFVEISDFEASTTLRHLDPQGGLLGTLTIPTYGESPTVNPDGSLWFEQGNRIRRVSPDGQELSVVDVDDYLLSTPAQDPAGNTYVVTSCGAASYSPTGKPRWRVTCDENSLDTWMRTVSKPALSADGTLVTLDTLDELHGIRDGKILWTVDLAGGSAPQTYYGCEVAIGPDGTVYVANAEGDLFALR